MLQSLLIVSFIVTVMLGAVYMAWSFRRMERSLILGGLLGGVVGGLGPFILMLPLNFCTFEVERSRLDVVFGLILFATGAWTALAIVKWLLGLAFDQATRARLAAEQQTAGTFRSTWLTPFLLLAPTLAILTVFLYYPLLETFRLSTLLARLGAPRTRFQCVSNFTSLISPEYGEVLFNTFFIATTIVVVGLILGLAIALLAFQPVRGANIYRTLLIWPYAISPAIAGIIFFVMFDPVAGIINHFIEQLGGTGLEWIRDPWLARFAVIITSIWKTLGYNILFYIAGLQTIPSNLLEAAAIDGANLWQRFLNIIVPGLSPITFFLIVTNITYAFFNIFGTIDYLTRGGPAGATSVSIYEIYLLGIRSKDLGRAAAQSLVLFLLVVIVTILQFRTSGRRVSYGA
jgi:sn-glycerol 3-phosphate transport system permease protein